MATFEPSPDLDPSVAQAIQQAMDALRAELMELLSSAGAASSTPAAVESGAGDRLRRLEDAVEALDRADSQAELLGALLRQAGSFAERALFLVLDDEELKGWAAYGFGDDPDVTAVALATPAGVESKRPSTDPEVCADICTQMGAEPAANGLLIPFALRGRVAGALYVDRLAGAAQLDRPALRILTYVAAQALETLPLRRPREVAEVEVATAVELSEPEPLPVSDVEAAEGPDVDVSGAVQEVAPPAAEGGDDEDSLALQREAAGTLTEEPRDEEAAEKEVSAEVAVGEEVSDEETPDVDADTATREADDEAIEIAERAFATQEISTVELPLDEKAVAPAPRPQPSGLLEDAEVVPPSDLEGPGWAFSGPESSSGDSRYEEARRLARLLVTEIKLYNEEKVRQGREGSNIYVHLRDDIERSRRIYQERIGEDVRSDTDYFQEEVVRILAGGNSTALGT